MNEKHSCVGSRRSKQSFWKHHIENWKNSDLTQVAYCQKQKLKKPSFQYWKKKFDGDDNAQTFLPVALAPSVEPGSPSSSSGIVLCVKGRFVVHLEDHFNGNTLSKLIDVLEVL